jgi:hypothetical protein
VTAQQFNARYPVGTLVRYFPEPVATFTSCIPTKTTSEAWDRVGREAIVSVAGFRDGVALSRIQVDGHE